MANELTITGALAFFKGGDDVAFGEPVINVTVTGSRVLRHRQAIGTSEETLHLGELSGATLGYAMFRNRGTGTITIRRATGAQAICTLKAGEQSGPFRLPADATTLYAIASVASDLSYMICED